jgi:hypothetical protein
MEQGKERRTLTIHIYTPSDAAHPPRAQPTHHPPVLHRARPAPRSQEPCRWEAAESPLAGAKFPGNLGSTAVQKYGNTYCNANYFFFRRGGEGGLLGGWGRKPEEALLDRVSVKGDVVLQQHYITVYI